jgi:2-methylcitrate dehydratase PrpD
MSTLKENSKRTFIKFSGLAAGTGLLSPLTPFAQDAKKIAEINPGKDATKRMAQYAINLKYSDLPSNIVNECLRAFVNYSGVTTGSCRHEAVDIAIKSLAPVSKSKQATILGRKERFDILNAAFINGVSSHVFDFDDTHLLTNVHSAGPIASALLAYSEYRPVSGQEFLASFYLGIEISIRLSNALHPGQASIGWHVSGTTPAIGAALAVGRLMGLTEQQMIWAIGLAASQPVGFRESFGSMNKSFNPGRAASNGLFSALLAKNNFTSSNQTIESRIGWANSLSIDRDYHEMLDDLGTRFETAKDTYKPFACGIVIHPAIDAAIQLRNRYKIQPEQIKSIVFKGNPMVLELTGKKEPKTGLEGKFSVYHSVAVAILNGKAGEKEYSDQIVLDAKTVAIRNKITVEIDPNIPKKSGDLTITLNDGTTLHQFVENAVGSVEVPMTNAQLNEKFHDLVDEVLPIKKSNALLDASWKIHTFANVGTFPKMSV